jgi:hypothetical protein
VGLVNVLPGELHCCLGNVLERWKGAGSKRSRSSSVATRRRPLEPVLRRARVSARAISACVSSRSVRQDRRAQKVRGLNMQ